MYNWNDLKVWKKFIMDWQPFEVLSYAQKVMWRWWSIINIKAKNLVTWANIPKTLSDNDRFEPADISKNEYDYLYNDWMNYYFMNNNTFEQVNLEKESLDKLSCERSFSCGRTFKAQASRSFKMAWCEKKNHPIVI